MKRSLLTIGACLLAAGIASAQEHGGKVDWVRDADFGLSKARVEGRAAMLYFTATW